MSDKYDFRTIDTADLNAIRDHAKAGGKFKFRFWFFNRIGKLHGIDFDDNFPFRNIAGTHFPEIAIIPKDTEAKDEN